MNTWPQTWHIMLQISGFITNSMCRGMILSSIQRQAIHEGEIPREHFPQHWHSVWRSCLTQLLHTEFQSCGDIMVSLLGKLLNKQYTGQWNWKHYLSYNVDVMLDDLISKQCTWWRDNQIQYLSCRPACLQHHLVPWKNIDIVKPKWRLSVSHSDCITSPNRIEADCSIAN